MQIPRQIGFKDAVPRIRRSTSTPFSMRSTLKPEFLAMSVAFDDQGEIVPGLGISHVQGARPALWTLPARCYSCFKRLLVGAGVR